MHRPLVLVAVGLALLGTPGYAQPVSLEALIDAAPAGSTLLVPPGIYRESVTVSKALVIDGQNQAEIRGSDVWTSWSQTGSTWSSSQIVPALPYVSDATRCTDGTTNCEPPEEVFVDGTSLSRAFSGSPSGGQFALDASRHVLLGSNPAGHTVEVTTRQMWVNVTADGVTLKNFTMRGSGTDAEHGAITNNGHAGLVIDSNHLFWAHGEAVNVGGAGTGVRITNNEIANNGQLGMSSYQSPNLVVSGNKLHDNAWAGFSCAWECGNAKLVSVPGLSFTGNESWNGHVGVWCDIGCTAGSIDSNNIHDNDQLGVFVEISSGMKVTNNTVTHNAFAAGHANQAGIWSSSSGGTEISGNTLVNNGLECCPSGAGIFASDEARSDAPSNHGTNISVHDNHITEPNGSRALAWWQIGVTTICNSGTNQGLNNWYHYPGPEDGELRFGWCHDVPDLASFQQTPGGQGGGYFDTPATPSPTATGTPTWTPSPTSTAASQPTSTPTGTATPAPVAASATPARTLGATSTPTRTATPAGASTATPTRTPFARPTPPTRRPRPFVDR